MLISGYKIKINNAFLFVFILLFVKCQSPNRDNTPQALQYLNIREIIEKQVDLLKRKNPSSRKTSFINGTSDTKILKNLDWEKELSYYDKININKPAYKDGFSLNSKVLNGKLYVNYIKKSNTKSDVKIIWTVYTPQTRKLQSILSKCITENPVFYKVANYEFHFDTTAPTLVLTRYKMQGNQKFIFGSQDIFSVEGAIIW